MQGSRSVAAPGLPPLKQPQLFFAASKGLKLLLCQIWGLCSKPFELFFPPRDSSTDPCVGRGVGPCEGRWWCCLQVQPALGAAVSFGRRRRAWPCGSAVALLWDPSARLLNGIGRQQQKAEKKKGKEQNAMFNTPALLLYERPL